MQLWKRTDEFADRDEADDRRVRLISLLTNEHICPESVYPRRKKKKKKKKKNANDT